MSERIVPGRFSGQTAVVTGGASGIGKEVVKRLLAEGAKVIASDLAVEGLATLADESQSTELITVAGDVTDSATVERIMDAAGGAVDLLANNAGVMDKFLPTAEMRDDVWEFVMRVNVTAPMQLSRAVLPGMVERGHGAIVNTASEAGLRGSCAGAAYTASKHAIIGLTKNDAFMYGPSGVRVNAVAPGPVRTAINAEFQSALAGQRLGPIFQTVTPPTAGPEEIAAAICWLLSEDAANVNGVVLPSDSGWSAI